MEFIVNVAQFEKMRDNVIMGMPELIDSKINFRGKNNILVCNNNIKLENVILDFNGDNSIVYLSSNLGKFFNLVIYNNSTIFVGNDVKIGSNVRLNSFESQNIFIGDDCVIEDNTTISTSDSYPIYNQLNHKRINFSSSVFIGDCVWIGANSFISSGVKIGSGTILAPSSFIPPYSKVPSNTYLFGNPAKIIKKDVFFINEFVGPFKSEDTINAKDYKSNIFLFEVTENETLSINEIDKILKDLDVESRLDFIKKLFMLNKRKNRFSIK